MSASPYSKLKLGLTAHDMLLCIIRLLFGIIHIYCLFNAAITSGITSIVTVVQVSTWTPSYIKTFNSTYSFYYCTWLDQPSETTALFSTVVCGCWTWFTIRCVLLASHPSFLHQNIPNPIFNKPQGVAHFQRIFSPQPFLDYEAQPLFVVSNNWDVRSLKLKLIFLMRFRSVPYSVRL